MKWECLENLFNLNSFVFLDKKEEEIEKYNFLTFFLQFVGNYTKRSNADHDMQAMQGRIQDFKLGGEGAFKKNCAERREARIFLGYFV